MPDIPDRPTRPFVPRQAREIPPAMPGRLWDRRLYHGTRFNFNIGDKIFPAETAGVSSNYNSEQLIKDGLRQHAYATFDIVDAEHWAGAGIATVPSGKRNIYLVSPINDALDEDGFRIDLDYDPYSETGIRSKTGFNIEGRFTAEGLENERATQATQQLVRNNVNELRFNIKGKAYFLHASLNEIEVGEKINTTTAKRLGTGMASDALPGRSYGFDALNPGSANYALGVHKMRGFIYITEADADLVRPDLNTGARGDTRFAATSSRAIKRGADYLR